MSTATIADTLRIRLRALFPADQAVTDVTTLAMKIVRTFRGYPDAVLREVMSHDGVETAAVRFLVHHADWGPRLRAALSTHHGLAVTQRQLRADFSYTLLGTDILAITDHGGDHRSVTNDAENVIDELGRAGLLVPGRHVIYRDTTGIWGGMMTREMADGRWRFVAFVPLQRDTLQAAIPAMIEFMATPKADQAVAA